MTVKTLSKGGVTGEDPSHAVPVHVISRDSDLVARFTAAGYAPGLTPPAGPAAGMESFFPQLLELLSSEEGLRAVR